MPVITRSQTITKKKVSKKSPAKTGRTLTKHAAGKKRSRSQSPSQTGKKKPPAKKQTATLKKKSAAKKQTATPKKRGRSVSKVSTTKRGRSVSRKSVSKRAAPKKSKSHFLRKKGETARVFTFDPEDEEEPPRKIPKQAQYGDIMIPSNSYRGTNTHVVYVAPNGKKFLYQDSDYHDYYPQVYAGFTKLIEDPFTFYEDKGSDGRYDGVGGFSFYPEINKHTLANIKAKYPGIDDSEAKGKIVHFDLMMDEFFPNDHYGNRPFHTDTIIVFDVDARKNVKLPV